MTQAEDRRIVIRTVLAAAALAFALETLLEGWDPLLLVGRLVVYPISVAIFWTIGWWLGTRTWPRRGRKLARARLVSAMKARREVLFISDRPDRNASILRRVWEAVAFAAGASVLVASILIILGFTRGNLLALATAFMLVAAWAGFILVPYWLFARMGMRHVDAVRWLILPLSRRYADRMRLSNGALILIALGAMINASLRTGATVEQAVVSGTLYIVQMVALVLVIAATGVAYYLRKERGLVKELEAEAIGMGIRDARGMSDGDFLPGLRIT